MAFGPPLLLPLPLLLLLVSSPLFMFAQAVNTLSQGQHITQNNTIVSDDNSFELGWFSPNNSGNHYVAIWYHDIIPLTTVWVANRDQPLKKPASFGISNDGNLVILVGNNTVIWSSNATSVVNSTALLHNSGNLVLRDNNDNTRWQSFDHPTDTFLPGMIVPVNSTGTKRLRFTSWMNETDPNVGRYAVGLDPSGLLQVYMFDGPLIRWRSGLWDGKTFIGTNMRSYTGYGMRINTDAQGRTVSLSFLSSDTALRRFVTQPNGVENLLEYNTTANEWRSIWSHPLTNCEVYNHCGSNAACNSETSRETCECLKGYEPRSAAEWTTGNWSSGCQRKKKLQCEENGDGGQDGFWMVAGVKLPDLADIVPKEEAGDEVACRNTCAGNCTCGAYAYVSGIGCMVWKREMVDLHLAGDGGTSGLYIKLAASELDSEGNGEKWILPLVLTIGVTALLLCSYLWWKYGAIILERWRKRNGEPELQNVVEFSRIEVKYQDFACPSDTVEKSGELPVLPFEVVAAATENFSLLHKLGEGGFGQVYKGKLPWGQEIAVKRLSRTSGQGLEEFKNEATLIAKLQHRNLVRLLGCCVDREEKMLVYEYLPNKSLDAILFDPSKKDVLDWPKRFNIIEGIARGLVYLHRDSRLRIIHRDLKASNVLLDEKLSPKISDFGMARIFGSDQNQETTERVVGTFGYMPPEYAMEGLFSVKSDVYSFGVLVLEILTGRKNSSFHLSKYDTNLAGHAWKLWKDGKGMELVDESMRDSISHQQVQRCMHVALLCVQDRAVDRPVMSTVVLMLEGEAMVLPTPRPPTYILVGSCATSESYEMGKEGFSSSELTITSLTSR